MELEGNGERDWCESKGRLKVNKNVRKIGYRRKGTRRKKCVIWEEVNSVKENKIESKYMLHK
jgi:hypothetical protein